jgi:peptidoglycan/xylan/chitin deacetylase (PgdA/CDA1 family)
MQDLNSSGAVIPNIAPTVAGGCPANPQAATDTSRCWWTCGGCTRDTDITECPTPMEWGLTYDDGPAFYTSNLLNYLDQQSLKSTFFVVGSRVISFPNILQTQYLGQHQIAVHTWSHPSLTTLTTEEIVAELGWSKKVIKDVLGVTPNMMRPPFGDIDDRVRAISLAMGLTPVMWTRISPMATFDTDDFNIHSGVTSVQQVLQNWENILGNATTRDTGFIVLEHDLFQESVEVATGYILPDALAHQPKFDIKPVISCLNKSLSDAYIETNDNSTNPPVSAVWTATVSGGTGAASGAAQASSSSSRGADSNANNSNAASALGVGLVTAAAGLGLVAGAAAIAF